MKPAAPGEQKIPRPGYAVKYPLRHGIVEDWDLMVRTAHVALLSFYARLALNRACCCRLAREGMSLFLTDACGATLVPCTGEIYGARHLPTPASRA